MNALKHYAHNLLNNNSKKTGRMLILTLRVYSALSILVTVLFVILHYSLQNKENQFFSVNMQALLKKYTTLNTIVIYSMIVADKVLRLSNSAFNQFAMFSGALLFLFNLLRFSILIENVPTTFGAYLIILIIFIISFINSCVRFSIFLMIAFQAQNRNIIFVLDNLPAVIKDSATHVQEHLANNAGSNIPRGNSLRRFGLIAGIFMVPLAAYSAYELHLTRKATENAATASIDSAKAAQDAAKASQDAAKALAQKTDIKAVKHGLMSPDEYRDKYKNL